MPGTAAEILDDDVRWVLTKGKLPAATWIEVITTAHELGLPTRADDDVRARRHPGALGRRTCGCSRGIQERTGGFTEFVLLPVRAPRTRRSTWPGWPGPGRPLRENRAVHAMARLLLHGADRQHPDAPGSSSATRAAGDVLRGGVNDLGGTLMEETISRMAGSEHGLLKTIADLEAMAEPLGRPARQRTTTYGEVAEERQATPRSTTASLASEPATADQRLTR